MFDPPPFARVDVFGAGQFGPERFVSRDHRVGNVGGLDSFGEQTCRLEIEKFSGDVDRGDVEVVRALPVGKRGMQLAGFGIDEIRRECTGVAPEERVRQRAVFPGKADEMQAYEQLRECVEQLVGQLGVEPARKQRAIRQRVPEVLRHQGRIELLAVVVDPFDHHPTSADDGQLALREFAQHAVLAFGHMLRQFFDRVDSAGDTHEAHNVARDAPRQRHESVGRPTVERGRPGQCEELARVGR